ncbi:hypothetical protein Prum_013360 [Phytohabitans rumicis]|uniref:Uncharacterized protein n=1 Tax=Phytohabitans rumicis TaxID=1076125 RepID=A0A6V8KV23_9ACTN|nr:hypothetical protein Prum_013360 [Phytohabitans rumicis]
MTPAIRQQQRDLHTRKVTAHRRHRGRGRPPQPAIGVNIRVVRRMDLLWNQTSIGRTPPRPQDRITDPPPTKRTTRTLGKTIQHIPHRTFRTRHRRIAQDARPHSAIGHSGHDVPLSLSRPGDLLAAIMLRAGPRHGARIGRISPAHRHNAHTSYVDRGYATPGDGARRPSARTWR